MAAPFPARIPKLFRKTITFDGKSGSGAVGTVKVGDVTYWWSGGSGWGEWLNLA